MRSSAAEAIDGGHFRITRIERPCAFAHGHDDVRDLVHRDRADRRHFVEAEPDIGEHDDDQSGNVEKQDEPGIEEPVGAAMDAEEDADDRADKHRHDIGRGDPAKRHAKVIGEFAARRVPDQHSPDLARGRKCATWPGGRRKAPQQAKPEQRDHYRQRRHQRHRPAGSAGRVLFRGAALAVAGLLSSHFVSSGQNVPGAISGALPTSFSPPISASTP